MTPDRFRLRTAPLLVLALLALSAAACRNAPPPSPAPVAGAPAAVAPDADQAQKGTATPRLIPGVTAANPIAVEAGLQVLRAGGSAADAAVAVQATLGLVEPQSSGLGGGAFLLYYDAHSGQVTAFDGRETAPAGATPDMFLDETGRAAQLLRRRDQRSLDRPARRRGDARPGACTTRPAAVERPVRRAHPRGRAGLCRAAATRPVCQQHDHPGDAARRARAVHPAPMARSSRQATRCAIRRTRRPCAPSLRTGPRALLEGPLAEQIVARVRAEPRPGTLTLQDLAAYRPQQAPALCHPFRVYLVCVPPPPSSGVGMLQLLGLLERTDIAHARPRRPAGLVAVRGGDAPDVRGP